VNVTCPYCRNVIKLKSVKPGRFTPKCPKCTKVFVLTVPADESKPATAAAYSPAPAAAPAAPAAPERTAAAISAPVLEQTAAALSAPGLQETTAGATPAPSFDQTAPLAQGPTTATGAGTSPPAGSSAGDHTEIFSPTSPPSVSGGVDTTVALSGSGPGASAVESTEAGQSAAPKTGVDGMPSSLGGYSIVKLLGKGGMGAVYLARQVSLDRNVALKVMNPHWAKDPAFLARFTREAYAAAQLVHHNIVQIYDIGEEHETPFFSMEFVQGKNLGEVTSAQGKLDVDEAVGYILQAGRGLKFAHDQGMVHRDIKPDNLMLNEQGIVKVADLGLVKTAGLAPAEDQANSSGRPASLTGLASLTNVTNVGVAMGTPSYMAPEQGRNAATVDHRADIYSLGCTLYVMLTGRPPFQGKSALEVMTKHLTEPVIAPDVLAKRVPKNLSAIILKMLAKKPDDRYADLSAVIADLEKFLGVTSAGPFTPTEEHAATLESAVKQFNNAPAARQRAIAVPATFGVMALLVLFAAMFGGPAWAIGVIGLAVMTLAGSFLTSGIVYRTHLFVKAREMLLDSSWLERIRFIFYAVLFLGALALIMGPLILILAALVAAGICSLYHILIERKLVEERAKALAKAEGLLKKLRLRGLEEEALRQFIAKYSGDHWEELYEALFGYELMIQARQRLAATDGGKRRAKHAAWRDPIIMWLESRQRQAREKRERKHLQKIEQKQLEAQGISKAEAKSRAAATADVMVDGAADMKKAVEGTVAAMPGADGSPAAPPKPLFNAKKLMEAASRAEKDHTKRVKRKGPSVLKIIYSVTIGPQPRFLLAMVLIFGCALWVYQNPELQERVKVGAQSALDDGSLDKGLLSVQTKPLHLPGLPDAVGDLFNWFNPAVAGILLIFSALLRNPRVTFAFFLAVVVLMFGPQLGVPETPIPFLKTPAQVSLAAGLALALIGVIVDRIFFPYEAPSRDW
jgi:eukaryotic-like serine/threonine-protein kinase